MRERPPFSTAVVVFAFMALATLFVVGMVGLGTYARYRWQMEEVRQQALADAIVREHVRRLEADAEYRERAEQYGD